ncbi:3-isopropylmalate dehydratase small subunit 1 [bioreactor metagenome]|uniref:3-isopropylmalate dehydratase n=1 Tax=bioreactor metagenome TaxID=1076179 RepID=A0A644WX61_9ZZZZ
MNFEKINIIKSHAVITTIENIDTDQIIPARFLKTTTREGFGDNMFYDWRYNDKREPLSNSPFNNLNRDYKILVAGHNFGCGSSREHAAWALYDYGFRVIISTFFADIFKNNALNTGILPVTIGPNFYFKIIENNSKRLIINLKEQTLEIEGSMFATKFDVPQYKKECLLNGYDDVEYLLSKLNQIELYEKQDMCIAR